MGSARVTALALSLLLFSSVVARAQGPAVEVYEAAHRTTAERGFRARPRILAPDRVQVEIAPTDDAVGIE